MVEAMQHMNDEMYMRQALALAANGVGRTHPNPTVGAVIISGGEVAGTGWHRGPGKPHAEVDAITMAGARATGSTLYVTLEPCSAAGRTPPCTAAILRAGIARVVYASSDPNPQMAGGGAWLQGHGVKVTANVLETEADALNRPFLYAHRLGRPYVIAKAAMSLDGKLATRRMDSKWISSELSRKHAHALRAQCHAILVGSGTLSIDNPSLTVRDVPLVGRPPLRVMFGSHAPAFHADYHFADGSVPARLYVCHENRHIADWQRAGVDVVKVDGIPLMLRHLAVDHRWQILLEGGGGLHAAFLEARLTDEMVLYQAPILIGGSDAVGLWQGTGVDRVKDAPRLVNVSRKMLGEDLLIRGRVVYPEA
ncbi:MAG: riboflavin biosynthesis protein RibD [Zetaproteobacteria bacterium CG12_big_fil_rev_8_21_14_0_65_55_1124]|nr:MAG: riboflavin biosynthesis protein RibD [Zetaproteobacteria bacterium CG08_land_8_20_14_0_20_55_17]PIW42211.1 MAG: riboflavin biosynthesis protein RibD [Zetaproteobacteria bacterium CG12_big_fil_rev_8_21_14_0_65_55_1124]PIY53780.1 MAG: riboflavin biosynthesis protein RibD [Zetaproteobacteria bacterium CG_4_10_14_0_8_um_filter_55_43]PIZ38473.1 MAG: riboflavin biosynthesis protein RibD [Zetaproteobacteria bacterium CG_4_10_14_0_2_um_filter_55_20]PJB80814.1 MAG: riboflavin biosynthesis protei